MNVKGTPPPVAGTFVCIMIWDAFPIVGEELGFK